MSRRLERQALTAARRMAAPHCDDRACLDWRLHQAWLKGHAAGLRTAWRQTRNPLMGAKEKGRKAWDAGKTLDDCPYSDARTDRGSVTWSRSFIRAWVAGWRERDTGAEWTP